MTICYTILTHLLYPLGKLIKCNENSKHIERITDEISNLKKTVTSLQKNNAELTQHILKCKVNSKEKNNI